MVSLFPSTSHTRFAFAFLLIRDETCEGFSTCCIIDSAAGHDKDTGCLRSSVLKHSDEGVMNSMAWKKTKHCSIRYKAEAFHSASTGSSALIRRIHGKRQTTLECSNPITNHGATRNISVLTLHPRKAHKVRCTNSSHQPRPASPKCRRLHLVASRSASSDDTCPKRFHPLFLFR